MIQKTRQEEKRKIQEAIYLSKREEAKQAKAVKAQLESRRAQIDMRVDQDNKMKNQIVVDFFRHPHFPPYSKSIPPLLVHFSPMFTAEAFRLAENRGGEEEEDPVGAP